MPTRTTSTSTVLERKEVNKSEEDKSLIEYEDTLQHLISCAELADCSPKNELDPKAEYYAASKKLIDIAFDLKKHHQNYDSNEVNEIAELLFQFKNSQVQLIALDLFADLPPNSKRVGLIIDTLQTHYDGELIAPAFNELIRYQDSENIDQIEDYLLDTLRTGSYNITEAVTENLQSFINSQNIDRFIELANDLPRNTLRSRELRIALSNFRIENTELSDQKGPKT